MEIFSDNVTILHTKHLKSPESYKTIRETCRGIIVKEGKILLSHEIVDDMWLIPGGGVENGESLEECCKREIAEEMGFIVRPKRRFAVINMYFDESKMINHFFECEIESSCERRLLDYEIEIGLTPEWVELDEAKKFFSDYEKYEESDKERAVIFNREFLALEEYGRLL